MSKEPESQPEERFPVGTSLYRAFFDKDSIWIRNIVVEAVDYEYTPKRKKRKAVYTVKGMNCTWRNGERLRKMDEAEITGESDTRKRALERLMWTVSPPEEYLLRSIFGLDYEENDWFKRLDRTIENAKRLKGMLLEWKDVLEGKEE